MSLNPNAGYKMDIFLLYFFVKMHCLLEKNKKK